MAIAATAAQSDLQDDFAAALRAQLDGHRFLRDTTMVTTPGDLPEAVQRYILREGLDPTRIRGVHAEGQTYLVLANIPDLTTGVTVALHEAVGHQGLRAVLGDDLDRVMLQLYGTFPREHDAWQHTAERYGYLDTGTTAGKVAFGEELCAHLAERDEPVSEWDMVQAEIRQAIRADFPELPMTDLDVRALVQRSRESLILRHGAPEEIEEVRQRQQRRQKAAGVVRESLARNGKGLPDAFSLALYRDGSRVVNEDGIPCRLFHGAGGEVDVVRRGFWGVVSPDLANEYAEMRGDQGAPAQVIPFYANIQRPFDGDTLKDIRATWESPDGLTPKVFVEELIRQGGVSDQKASELRSLAHEITRFGRREESGPAYSPQDFWYMPHWMFGLRGQAAIEQAFEMAGFDGVRFTEQGSLTYGAFHAAQVHFLDQGASPRGWQPDRHHGEGPVTQRQPFRDWFGDSMVVDAEGQPRVMYHGTSGDITAFREDRIRSIDLDADCNGFWFSSSQGTSPAMQDPSNIMPVYLAVQNPAPYPLVEKVSREVRRDGTLRSAARSEHDEVRYRLQEMGYDGFVFTEPTRLSQEQRETFEANGEVALQTNRGREIVLRRGSFKVRELQDVEYEVDVLAYETPEGKKGSVSLAELPDLEVLRNLVVSDALPAFTDPDEIFVVIDQISALRKGEVETVGVAGVTLTKEVGTRTYPDFVPTGEVREVVDFYDEMVGHVTGYESLEDFEEMHSELVVVAFRPEQIKSAIGNRGSFLRSHPDVRFSVSVSMDPSSAPVELAVEEIARLAPQVEAAYASGHHEAAERLDARLEALYQRVEDGYHQAEEEGLAVDGMELGKATASRPGDETDEESSFALDLGNRYAELFHGREAAWHSAEDKVQILRGVVEDYSRQFGGMREGVSDGEILAAGAEAYELLRERHGRGQGVSPAASPEEAFSQWFGRSVVVDDQGAPLIVYRGEHGQVSPRLHARFGPSFQSRAEALSFSSAEVASVYSLEPNDRADSAEYSRVTPAYLSLQNPVMNRPDDPYLEMEDVISALGRTLATRLAREMAEHIEATDHWRDTYGEDYTSVAELLEDAPGKLDDLYLQAYPVFDEARYVSWFRAAGFDGAVHGGSAVSAGVAEYKVFSPEQVKSVFNRGTFSPHEPDIRLSVAPEGERPVMDNPAFRAWFDGSRVVDGSGMPLVVYKGMHPYDWRTETAENPRGEEITAIDRPTPLPAFFEDDPGVEIAGFFGDRDTANHFGTAATTSGALYPVYLSLKAPYEVDAAGAQAGELQFGATGQAFREAMRSDQYDGAILHNTGDEGTVYIAKRADQIKSVFNAGAFDPAEPDIRLSLQAGGLTRGDRLTLDYARRAVDSGFDPTQVKSATGWIQGDDGGWRFTAPQSEAFDRWFGASQVAHEDGAPRVMFHGTLEDFEAFRPGPDEFGIHFGTEAAAEEILEIKSMGEPGLGRKVAAYLAIENPIRLEDLGDWHPELVVSAVRKADPRVEVPVTDAGGERYYEPADVIASLQDAGYDGVVYQNAAEDVGNDSYIAFHPDQIKPLASLADPRHAPEPSREERFSAWFRDSKVVDRRGEPLTVYHGTENDFTAFQRKGLNEGHFFAQDRQLAEGFAGPLGKVMDAHLSIQNPVDLRGDPEAWELFHGGGYIKALEERGHDGAILHEPAGDFSDGTEVIYVAFRPEQVKSASQNRGTYDPDNPDIRFSFAGQVARSADRMQLHHAHACLAAGMDEDLVRQETGWFRGLDGGWRFEIDDSKAALRPALRTLRRGELEAARIVSFDYRAHEDGTYSVSLRPEGAASTTDFIDLEHMSVSRLRTVLPWQAVKAITQNEGVDEWGGLMPEAGLTVRQAFDFHGLATLPLCEVLDHPALFEAYSRLRDLPVTVDPRQGANASLVTVGRHQHYVELGRANNLSSLLHELQHVIQYTEGFAQGGSVDRMHEQAVTEAFAAFEQVDAEYGRAGLAIPEVLSAHAALDSARLAIMHELGLDYRSRAAQAEMRHLMSDEQRERLTALREAYWVTVEEAGGFGDERVTDFVDAVMEREDARMATSISTDEALDRYRRLAGEVEARNVQARMGMSFDERQATPPETSEDIVRGQQVVLVREGVMESKDLKRSLSGLIRVNQEAGEVANLTRAGEALQAVSDELLGVLDAAGHKVGWMDGGCRILAEAMVNWSAGDIRLAVTGSDEKGVSHAVGAMPLGSSPGAMAVLLDADGVSAPEDLVHKLESLEASGGERVLALGVRAETLAETLPADPALSARLSRMLEMRLGPYSKWKEEVQEEVVGLGYPLTLEAATEPQGKPELAPHKATPSLGV